MILLWGRIFRNVASWPTRILFGYWPDKLQGESAIIFSHAKIFQKPNTPLNFL